MSLLQNFFLITFQWRQMFCKTSIFFTAVLHSLAFLCSSQRKTVTSLIEFLGKQSEDWSYHYKFYSRKTWEAQNLFRPIISKSLDFFHDNYIQGVADYTGIRKTGKRIPNTGWMRDPMSPPFRHNLCWGQSFLQCGLTIPLYNLHGGPPRSLPVRWKLMPRLPKPRKDATDEEWQRYKDFCEVHNRSKIFMEEVRALRDEIDQLGGYNKRLLMSLDGDFCNQRVLRPDCDRTDFICRARKNIKLCFAAKPGGRRFYSKEKFTPEDVRQEDSISWKCKWVYHGGEFRQLYYKEVKDVYWQGGARRRKLRLFVLRSIPYRRTKKGRLLYRKPAYLLCTDLFLASEKVLQCYFDRWQIECNFKEEKDVFGIGEAHLRNQESIIHQTTHGVASYSALLLSSILSTRDQRDETYDALPKWYKSAKRPSCKHIVKVLSANLPENFPEIIKPLYDMIELKQSSYKDTG